MRRADRRAAATLEALVGPGDRAGLGGVEEAKQDERDRLRAKLAGVTSQSTSQNATTSSQTTDDGSAWPGRAP